MSFFTVWRGPAARVVGKAAGKAAEPLRPGAAHIRFHPADAPAINVPQDPVQDDAGKENEDTAKTAVTRGVSWFRRCGHSRKRKKEALLRL